MNKARLKTYAPQARRDFIAAVEARAHLLGLSGKGGTLDIAPGERKGDIAVIAGQAWPAKVHEQRERLIRRMQKDGFAQTVEAVAYTWFNRFAALRYMEIHDYLDHGHRVLSSREGGLPEIIAHATELAAGSSGLPGLNAVSVAEMKLAGNQDGELYRLLLVAQCNALSKAMPFLFERIDDESELLLPGNLERTDSVVARLVEAIPEEDWNEVEVIGWLYQFYISEKKDEVIGKVVKSEDIPAATQLFTPNWIVQYLVQNSVGRLWLMANPASSLKSQWPYYIEPAEQTPEVQTQLDALIKTRMAEDSPLPPGEGPGVRAIGSLNPETITVLDPACGSGHILVEAYAVLKGIYLERGYPARSIPRLILEKNLYGLDIDDRAAQLAGFALLMKARADDRRLLDGPIKLNVLSLQGSAGMDLDEFAGHLRPHGIDRTVLGSLLDTFSHAKTFGSLIQIPKVLEDGLAGLEDGIAMAIENGDVFARAAAQDLVPLVRQAKILAMKFDAVVANPPYMGSQYFTDALKNFLRVSYPTACSDIYPAFIEKAIIFSRKSARVSMVTLQNWLFLSGMLDLRKFMLSRSLIESVVQVGFNSFPTLNSKFAIAAMFSLAAVSIPRCRSRFINLNNAGESDDKELAFISRLRSHSVYDLYQDDFNEIPECIFAYDLNEKFRLALRQELSLRDVAPPRRGLATGDNPKFIRGWFEVDFGRIGFGYSSGQEFKAANKKYAPYNMGGRLRKWSGNNEFVIDWEGDGYSIKNLRSEGGRLRSRPQNIEHYFKQCITWKEIGIEFCARLCDQGAISDQTSDFLISDTFPNEAIIAFLNSTLSSVLLKALNPTLHFNVGTVGLLPLNPGLNNVEIINVVKSIVRLAKDEWDEEETSYFFSMNVLVKPSRFVTGGLIGTANDALIMSSNRVTNIMSLETELNRQVSQVYGLDGEVETCPNPKTLGVEIASRNVLSSQLCSYAIGCMMGRYSLDEPGLIYAHAGNVGFDATRYKTFPADADGILPITDELWFEDDAANRVREFLSVVWSAPTLDENMAWLAESLGVKGNETPDETIRRYLSSSFFKDHCSTYKKRPIYWLFRSGKQGAFQALVYLHRYYEGTLARLRAEYVVPLTGKMQSRIEMLEKDKDTATSTAARNRIAKQIESLKKKHVELLAYDEKLRHYADMRISLDLDDGVKVNYGKFGDLLDSVKIVTGGASDD